MWKTNWSVCLGIVGLGLVVWAGPQLQVDPQVYDFGSVYEGYLVEASFTLTNVGDEPLTFSRQPGTSCGCTSAPLPKLELAPGESMQLVAYFDSTGFGERDIHKYVYVYTSDPRKPAVTLLIQGHVVRSALHEEGAPRLYRSFRVLIDLRTPQEYEQVHLLGAINLAPEEVEGWLSQLPPWIQVVVYDATGTQAGQLASELHRRGFRGVQAIAGGLAGWWRALGDHYLVWQPGAEHVPPPGAPAEPTDDYLFIDPQDVAETYLVVLDLRPPEEFAQGHLPGSVNLEPSQLAQWAASLPPISPGGRLYIWCIDGDGTVACQAAQWLWANGYPFARCVVGGLGQWQARYQNTLLIPSPAD
jgi:rhodanese-related sulfurtransferase